MVAGTTDSADDANAISERQQRRGSKKAIRRMSWGAPGSGNKRTNRRSVANSSDCLDPLLPPPVVSSVRDPSTTMGEVENGAIPYPANLLGNRPRIMDVCIPKLKDDSRVCDEWGRERREGLAANGVGGAAAAAAGNTMLE